MRILLSAYRKISGGIQMKTCHSFRTMLFMMALVVLIAPQGFVIKNPASVESPTAASFPFYEGFESGTLGSDWLTYTTNQGRVQVGTAYPYAGRYSLLLDDSLGDSTYSYAAAILTIDLSGQSQVDLDFWWRKLGDEDHASDGVFISADDGANWYKLLSFNIDPTGWRHQIIDLDEGAAANGLTFNNHFQIKFQFYDNDKIPTDGYAIDEVRVRAAPSPIPAAFPFYDGFETGTLGPAWMVDFTNEGRVQVGSTNPYTGTYSLLLDDWESDSIYSTAAAILTIDLSGATQVKLDFLWRKFSDESHASDGVFISADEGTNWFKAFSFNVSSSDWKHEVIELDDLISANGLAYNDRFQIKFQFYDNDKIPTDGYAIDEVTVRPNAAPQLTWVGIENYIQDGLHPEQGNQYDSYTYQIRYSDLDEDPPEAVELHIKKGGVGVASSPFVMSCVSGDYKAGVACSHTRANFTAGQDYTYFFVAQDDHGNHSSPTAELNGPNVVFSYRVVLPALLRDAGPPRSAPVLDPISNPGGSYAYTLQWSQVALAEIYTLEEDDNPNFSSPAVVYHGPGTSTKLSAQDVGTYYYRVKASNKFGSSDWSNTESVVVTIAPPPCPQAGGWSGRTNAGYGMKFSVTEAPNCKVTSLTIYHSACPHGVSIAFLGSFAITNDSFNTGNPESYVRGTFTSRMEAAGQFQITETCPGIPPLDMEWSGTWTASYQP
jgi:hypothetical protein